MQRQLRSFVICCMWLWAGAAAAGAATLTVGAGQQYTTIQSAINAANAGDTVFVYPGTYTENIDFIGKAITVSSTNGPTGGAANTIIDGHSQPGVATVTFQSGELRTSMLNGFTITGGGHSAGGGSKPGGIYVANSAPTITNNIITANTCYGINVSNGDAYIADNDINSTVNGSATACSYSGAAVLLNGTNPVGQYSYSAIEGNTIENNVKGLLTGGVMIYAAEGTVVESNIIRNNASQWAGALLVLNTFNLTVVQNLVYGNSATGNGITYAGSGGVSIMPPPPSVGGTGTVGPFVGIIANNTITGNSMQTGVAGEAASDLYLGGNLAQYVVVNNIVSGSSTTMPAFNCGTIYSYLTVTPLVIDHNDIYNSVGGAAYGGSCSNQTGTFGNISKDPMFANTVSGNYQVIAGSPVIDSGNNSVSALEALPPPVDISGGSARSQDATGLGYPVIDMGAYEYAGALDAIPATLTLKPNSYSPAAGTLIFTVALFSSVGSPLTGPVTLYQNGTSMGTVTIGSSGTAQFPAGLGPGLYAFIATYPGASPFDPAVSVKLYIKIANYSPTLTLNSAPNPSTQGQSVTFAATITTPDNAVLSPIVLTDTTTSTQLASLTPNSSGMAMFAISTLAVGTHSVTASFAGDSTHNAVTSAIDPQVVKPAVVQGSTSTLTASPNPAAVGANVTLTATVTPNPASTTVPTGTVVFYDGGIAIGTGALNASGVATFITSTLPAGVNSLSCTYSGDTNFTGSSCAAITENILAVQAITFPQPASPAYAGTSVLLSATASSGAPVTYMVISGPADVSGSVLHYNGAGTVVVEADQAGNSTYAAAAPVQKTVTATLLSVPVGTQSASVTTLITVNTAGTLSAINVLTSGTANLDFNNVAGVNPVIGPPCTVGMTYSVGQTCIATFTFTPTHPGLRFGGITLANNAGVTLGATNMYGLGTGPQVVYSPATQSLLGGYYSYPTGVAEDAAGDVFLTDETGNAVNEIPAGSGVSQQIGSFTAPDDVAVDGSGNVFVIYNRTSLAEIMAVNGVIPANPTVNVISTSFAALNGMKVDGNGNVYLASSYSGGSGSMIQEVLAVNGSIPQNPTVLTLVSNVGGPTGVAVDSAGDVYFSDEIGNTAWEAIAVNGVIPATPNVVALATGLNLPTNIALDAAGDVFVSEFSSVAEIEAVNGSIPANPTVVNLGTNLVFPQGLAVDASGNVLIADDGIPQAVKLDFADAPSLTFAATPVGSTSTDSPQTVTLINDGNTNLSWVGESSPTDPSITAGYSFTSTCPIVPFNVPGLMGTIAPGGSCAESISFKPVAVGPDPGKWTLTDNNLNVSGAQQNILLNGTGTIDTTQLAITLNPNPVYALQNFTATVTLTLGNGTGGAVAPDPSQPITLTFNPGTGPVVVNLTTNANGVATYTFAGGLNAGNYLIAAAFAGTSSQQASSNSNTEVVNAYPTVSVLTVTPAAPVTTSNVVLNVTVTAPLTTGVPTGTVTFFNGAVVLGTTPLNSSGVATLPIGILAAGTYTFTCMYNGALDYATSTCAPVTVTVIPPPDFSLTASPPAITIETQHHGTMQLTLAAIGSFAGRVQLGCQGPLPPYVTCELPGSETLALGQTVNFNFTMDTDAVLNFLAKSSPTDRPAQKTAMSRMVLALLLPLALAGFARRRKALRRALLLLVLAVSATALTACGDKWPAHTPPGVYTIPVVGMGTAPNGTVITHTLNITLTVTP